MELVAHLPRSAAGVAAAAAAAAVVQPRSLLLHLAADVAVEHLLAAVAAVDVVAGAERVATRDSKSGCKRRWNKRL